VELDLDLPLDMGLTEPVAAAVDEAVRMVESVVTKELQTRQRTREELGLA
jgi:hypothetical protein